MSWIDISIFVIYMIIMLGVGFYFLGKNKSVDDYYVGGRNMSSLHVGLSVVATDVGGGFSIGLGGLGFAMGISGSWMLFTGLIGAWLSAVLLIPYVHKILKKRDLLTFPQVFHNTYGPSVAIIAAIISAIGYLGFTSSQLLAGAKLASSTFDAFNINEALMVMGIIAVVYTVMGGLKAVIYTDTVQWIILMGGLLFIGIPLSYTYIGGWEGIKSSVAPEFLRLDNLRWQDALNWFITIVPIWFVGMTLYQRIYACRSSKQAQKAWFIAGLFEWPIMAFVGVLLGLFSRVAFQQGLLPGVDISQPELFDAELGLPLLIREVMPIGLLGLMMSAYFSAVLSTADSCLMASSGNIVNDLIEPVVKLSDRMRLRLSQIATLIVGCIALLIAWQMENVLSLMLHAYAFMVSGLLIPIIAALFLKKPSHLAALVSMLVGGGTTLTLIIGQLVLDWKMPLGLDANLFGISLAAISFILISLLDHKNNIYEIQTDYA